MISKALNKKIPFLIDWVIKCLVNVKKKYYSKDEEIKYRSLSPIDTKDSTCEYSKALKWALDNRKEQDIKNIALTGPYGAGKSTILKTLQNNCDGKQLKFLPISLATFKEEKPIFDDNGNINQVDKSELLKRIETSILEQIFYKEKDHKTPDSRFKRIKSYSRNKLFFLTIAYLLFISAIYNIYRPYYLELIFKDLSFSGWFCDFIHYCSYLIVIIGLFCIIRKSVRLISAITINKLKIQNAEIGIGDNLNKSILNHHIDELLYFFYQTKYNVVIIEDLDRFEETEIFTKLREINLILNNSEKTKALHIVFIYAVRDNIFIDKERTKFFDFIVPVIPYINPSNSSDKLLSLKTQNDFELNDDLIEDISYYIDDMRLLNNITNEFYLYSNKIVGITNYNKLFALLTYKNIYPSDFMELSNNKSILNTVFDQRTDFIKSINDKIDSEIDSVKEQIKNYSNILITNVEDLRRLYLIRIIEKLDNFDSFIINQSKKSIDEVVKDEFFPYIISNNYEYNKKEGGYYEILLKIMKPIVDFSIIEQLVDNSKTYLKKEEELKGLNNGVINSLKRKIQELEKEKLENRKLQLSELIKSDKISDLSVDEKFDKIFILMLLRNGYIAEDYLDYITLFHGESITRDDYQFHISIKNRLYVPFDFKLSKIDKLISKINPLDFQTKYILNYQIMDYLLAEPKKYQQNLIDIFSQLKDESKVSIDFIKSYFVESQEVGLFIKYLCNYWSNFYNYVERNSDFTSEMKKDVFKSIIEFADRDAIKNISDQSTFRQVILNDPDFLLISTNQNKLIEIISALDIKFTSIDFNNSPDELLSYIYENNHYELNVNMVISIIQKFGEFKQLEFDNSNYEAIKSSNAIHLIEYIDNYINQYIENVYLKIDTNINEKEDFIISILNNEGVTFKNKEFIIISTNTNVEKLELITDIKLIPILLQNNKVKATWENLLYAFNNQPIQIEEEDSENELDIIPSVVDFININQNAEDLSKIKIPTKVNEINIYGVFWKKILNTDEIKDDIYDKISKSNPWLYKDLKFNEISDIKIKSLINRNCLNPIIDTFNELKENSEGLNIYLLEKRKVDYFKILDELDFDSYDLELILKSEILTNYEKQKLLNHCTNETIITDDNLKLLTKIKIEDNTFNIDESVLKALLNNRNIPVNERILIFNRYYNQFEISFVESFLENLDGNYVDVADKSKKAKIIENKENENLLKNLIQIGYISSISKKNNNFIVHHRRK